MKKHLFIIAIATACAVAFVSCKPDPNDPTTNPNGDATLKVTPNELTLVLGDNPVSLSATLTPNVSNATIKWTSSNTDVATVTNRGYVEAVDYGECYIYAEYNGLKDSCHVHVKTFLESAVFNGAIVWEEDTTYLKDDKTGEIPVFEIEASSGEKYRVYKALATLFVFSDGFYIDNSGHFAGTEQGVILEIEAPMYYASKYLNNSDHNTVFCLGEWGVTDNVEYMRESEPGSIDEVEYVKQMKNFLAAFNAEDASYVNFLQAAAKAVKNPTLNSYEYDTDDQGQGGYYSSRIPEAICTKARMSLNNNFAASDYMCGMDYSEITYKQLAQDTTFEANWGLNIGYNDEQGVYLNDEQVHFYAPVTSTFGTVPSAEEAPAMKPIRVPVLSQDAPEIAARVKEQINKYPNVIKLRKK